VTRGEARPLRPIPLPMHRAAQRLSSLTAVAHVRWQHLAVSHSGADADPPRHMAGGASLGRIPASRVSCHPRRHRPDRVRYRTAASCAVYRLAPIRGESTCENQAPTPWRGLGDIKHERDAFRRVVRDALARFPESFGSGFDPTVRTTRTPVRDVPSPIASPHSAAMTAPCLSGSVCDASTSRESFRC
jgi:hypothetical protein